MKAIIMAGGFGTRLRPLTCDSPKPLAKIAGKYCILYVLDCLKAAGITDVCVTLMYKPEAIKEALLSVDDMNISYSVEKEPMGTAGSVRLCRDFLTDDDFIVISGDCVCDFDLKKAIEFHKNKNGVATVVLSRTKEPLEYGIAVTSSDGSIMRFVEKPSWSRAYSDTVNTGIYVLSPGIFDYVSEGNCDFSKNVFPEIMKKEKIYGFSAFGYWCDVGNIQSYSRCNREVLDGTVKVPRVLNAMKTKKYEAPEGTEIIMPSYIGENVMLKNAKIGPYAVICDGSSVEGASVSRSVLLDGVKVCSGAEIRGSIICENATVCTDASVGEMSVIGAGSIVGGHSVVGAGAKVYPKKIIPEYTFIRTNVIEGLRGLSAEDESFSDALSSDLDLSSFVSAGGAAADIFKRDIAVAVCSSSENILAPMLALCSGISARGVDVFDLGKCDINSFRFAVRHFGFGGGVYIKEDSERIFLVFLETDGLYIRREYERKLEQFLESKELSYVKNGSLRTFLGSDRIYKRRIRSLLNGIGNVMNVSGTDYFSECIPHCGKGSYEYMHVLPESLVIQTPRKEAYPDDTVRCVSAFCIGKLTGTAVIPYDYPTALNTVSEKNGFALIRTTLEDLDRARLCTVYDTNIRAASILRYMTEKSCSFADIVAQLPPFSTKRREVGISSDKASVMRELSADGKTELVDGVKIFANKGTVLIVPKKSSGSFSVSAEATDAETAAEICDFYVKKLRNH